MPKQSHKDNTVGPWAAQKLNALRAYLNYYTTYLKNIRYWQKIYVDAFAGAGGSTVRAQYSKKVIEDSLFDLDDADAKAAFEYLKGSPAVALEVTNAFDRYVFIEQDSSRIEELRSLVAKSEYSDRVEIIESDATDALGRLADQIKKARHRAVIFIDPYGLNIEWSVIEKLGKTGAVEIILNFAWAMAINRLMVKHGDIPDNWRLMLNKFFGDEDWYRLVYETSDDLFGQKTEKAVDAEKRILKYYIEKLKRCFGHVGPPMLVRNTKNNPLYYLIWAGPHPAGLKGANHILSQGETVTI